MIQKTADIVDAYAEDGLRTLYLATKKIDPDAYSEWNEKFKEAEVDMKNREKAMSDVYEMIEGDLTLIGSTAIEDKLQENVADTI